MTSPHISDEEAIAELIQGIVDNPMQFGRPEYELCDHDWSGHRCELCDPGYHIVCSKCNVQLCAGLFDREEEADEALEVVSERIFKSLAEDDTIDPGTRYHA